MKVILIVHNQLELLQLELESLKQFTDIEEKDIVIADNYSDDGTSEWLQKQKEVNYLLCDEGIEGYSVIVNTAVREFQMTGDILILTPNYMVLPGTVQKLQRALDEDKRNGAVTALLTFKDTEKGMDYSAMADCVEQISSECGSKKQTMNIPAGAVLMKKEMLDEIGGFDERLRLPKNGIMDCIFRGMCFGYRFYQCENAYFFKVDADKMGYEEKEKSMIDRETLKQIWEMNYFNVSPNPNIVWHMLEEKDAPLDVLEIGCDCGANLLEIKNNFPNARLYGVELNTKAAEVARSIAKVQVADIEEKNIQFDQMKFDYIIFGDVLEHLHDPAGTLRYCRELLKDDGKIIASIPNIMHYTVMRELLRGNFTYTDMGLLDRTHIHFFTYKEIVRMFVQEGFQIEQIDGIPSYQEASQEEQKFVKQLYAISEEVEEAMFYVFQYVVRARKIE